MLAPTPIKGRLVPRLALAIVVGMVFLVVFGSSGVTARGVPGASARFPCSGSNSAHVPCHFTTPSGNIRCLWTPHPNTIACELLASRSAYRLGPYGHAKAIVLRLARRGETLRGNQQIEFPQNLSCHDTARTMTCNQDYGHGAFTLARGHSHKS
jgi:hypothetical protein